MPEVPNLCLTLSNRPEDVAVVHEAMTGVAQALGLDALEAGDLDTAVGEACKNVVWHAYEGTEGPLELELYADGAAVEVVVRDHGIGIRPHVGERTLPHTGIGLPIVHVLTRRVVYTNLPDGGTELRMHFEMPGARAPERPREAGPALVLGGDRPAGDTLEMSLAPVSLASSVLPGVLGALAVRAGFGESAAAAVRTEAAALAAGVAESTIGARLDVAATVAPGELELFLGPLRQGAAAALLDAACGRPGAALQRVDGGVEEMRGGAGEALSLRLRPRV